MTEFALDTWQRAVQSLKTADLVLSSDPDTSGSCSYYAAFYAVTAWFALMDVYFKRHSGLRAAVHAELVNKGRVGPEFGDDYDSLLDLRTKGDYGASEHVSEKEAAFGLEKAKRILGIVAQNCPQLKVK